MGKQHTTHLHRDVVRHLLDLRGLTLRVHRDEAVPAPCGRARGRRASQTTTTDDDGETDNPARPFEGRVWA